jgi:hypothetical protein
MLDERGEEFMLVCLVYPGKESNKTGGTGLNSLTKVGIPFTQKYAE